MQVTDRYMKLVHFLVTKQEHLDNIIAEIADIADNYPLSYVYVFSIIVTVATNPTRLLLFALPLVFLRLDISKNLFTFGFLLMFLDIFFNLLMRCLIVFWQTFKSFIFLKVHRLPFRLL